MKKLAVSHNINAFPKVFRHIFVDYELAAIILSTVRSAAFETFTYITCLSLMRMPRLSHGTINRDYYTLYIQSSKLKIKPTSLVTKSFTSQI